MNLLIVEDELPAARELAALLNQLRPNWSIAASLQSIDETIAWLSQHTAPDLIFSDIQLADGLSFQIFTTVNVACPVIFCTAFDQYAIRAFETNGIDYLLKPIESDRLAIALRKYETLTRTAETPSTLSTFQRLLEQLNRPASPTTLLVYHRETIIPLKVSDIAFVHYAAGVVSATTLTNQRYTLTQPLDELERMLPAQQFYRANRQLIIHRQSVVNAEHYFGRKLIVRLALPTPEPVLVSKAKAIGFLSWLQE